LDQFVAAEELDERGPVRPHLLPVLLDPVRVAYPETSQASGTELAGASCAASTPPPVRRPHRLVEVHVRGAAGRSRRVRGRPPVVSVVLPPLAAGSSSLPLSARRTWDPNAYR
jgi:hypothetical protein